MIIKRIKKISKIFFLILVRQAWLFLSNCYNLIFQPDVTLRKISTDKSQKLLLTIMVLMPSISYIGARILWDYYKYGGLINSVGKVFVIVLLTQVIIFSYLIYWLLRVIFYDRTTKRV
jgi:hypothetical protein